MSYFAPEDLEFILMEDQRIIIGDTSDSTISNANAQKMIDMAEAYVNMRLAKKYVIPFTIPTSSSQVLATIEWNYIKGIIANKFAYFLLVSAYAANIPNRNEYAESFNIIAEDMISKLLGDEADIELTTQTLSTEGEESTEGPTTSVILRSLDETLSMTGIGELNYSDLTYSNVRTGSELLRDITKTTTYVKGTDYDIDYIEGRIWRLTASTIPSATSIYITYWYYPEDPFAPDRVRYETDAYKEI